jgi:long-chain acyl-CoA synthetase
VQPTSKLAADLGFDSLLFTELTLALEQAGVLLPSMEDLSQIETVEDLRKLVASTGKKSAGAKPKVRVANEPEPDREIPVPEPLANLGRDLLSFGQRILYGGIFDVKISGKNFIPQNQNFLVIANHTSHLDMGLVKVILGEQGERLTALAARDYFFSTPLKRAYFENFTNLIPMDRHGSLRESLKLAGQALEQGYNLLLFPEGTRSITGELQEFKPTLGYLSLTYRVDILPIYLHGTFDAMPKGSLFPKKKELEVRIGPVLSYRECHHQTEKMARSEGYRFVTHLAEDAVKALRDGKVPTPRQDRSDEGTATDRKSSGGGGDA